MSRILGKSRIDLKNAESEAPATAVYERNSAQGSRQRRSRVFEIDSTKTCEQSLLALAALALAITGCGQNQQHSRLSEDQLESWQASPTLLAPADTGMSVLEEALRPFQLGSFKDFLQNQAAQDAYFDAARSYYSADLYSSRTCFDVIVKNLQTMAFPEGADSDAGTAESLELRERIWSTDVPGKQHWIPTTTVDFKLAGTELGDLQKLRTRHYLKWVNLVDNQVPLGLNRIAMKTRLRSMLDRATEPGRSLDSKVINAIAGAVIVTAYKDAQVSASSPTVDQNMFLNLWNDFRDQVHRVQSEMDLNHPSVSEALAAHLPTVANLIEEALPERKVSNEAFTELSQRRDTRIIFSPPPRRLHSVLKYGFSEDCSSASPYLLVTTLLKDSLTFTAEQDKVFKGYVDLVPLVYKWRQQNPQDFDNRYIVYSPLYFGKIFGDNHVIRIAGDTRTTASGLRLWSTAFAAQLPENATGVGGNSNYLTFGSQAARQSIQSGHYHFSSNVQYSQMVIGRRSDLALLPQDEKIVGDLLTRADPGNDPMRTHMAHGLTLLTSLILNASDEFKLLPVSTLKEMSQSVTVTKANFGNGAGGCAIPMDMLRLLDFNQTEEIKALLNCIEHESELLALTQGDFSSANNLRQYASLLSKLVGYTLVLDSSTLGLIASHSELMRLFESAVDRMLARQQGGSPSVAELTNFAGFMTSLGSILGFAADESYALRVLEKVVTYANRYPTSDAAMLKNASAVLAYRRVIAESEFLTKSQSALSREEK